MRCKYYDVRKTVPEFISDAEHLLIGAAANDDFVKIKTRAGNAILISEDEWNVLIDAMKLALNSSK